MCLVQNKNGTWYGTKFIFRRAIKWHRTEELGLGTDTHDLWHRIRGLQWRGQSIHRICKALRVQDTSTVIFENDIR